MSSRTVDRKKRVLSPILAKDGIDGHRKRLKTTINDCAIRTAVKENRDNVKMKTREMSKKIYNVTENKDIVEFRDKTVPSKSRKTDVLGSIENKLPKEDDDNSLFIHGKVYAMQQSKQSNLCLDIIDKHEVKCNTIVSHDSRTNELSRKKIVKKGLNANQPSGKQFSKNYMCRIVKSKRPERKSRGTGNGQSKTNDKSGKNDESMGLHLSAVQDPVACYRKETNNGLFYDKQSNILTVSKTNDNKPQEMSKCVSRKPSGASSGSDTFCQDKAVAGNNIHVQNYEHDFEDIMPGSVLDVASCDDVHTNHNNGTIEKTDAPSMKNSNHTSRRKMLETLLPKENSLMSSKSAISDYGIKNNIPSCLKSFNDINDDDRKSSVSNLNGINDDRSTVTGYGLRTMFSHQSQSNYHQAWDFLRDGSQSQLETARSEASVRSQNPLRQFVHPDSDEQQARVWSWLEKSCTMGEDMHKSPPQGWFDAHQSPGKTLADLTYGVPQNQQFATAHQAESVGSMFPQGLSCNSYYPMNQFPPYSPISKTMAASREINHSGLQGFNTSNYQSMSTPSVGHYGYHRNSYHDSNGYHDNSQITFDPGTNYSNSSLTPKGSMQTPALEYSQTEMDRHRARIAEIDNELQNLDKQIETYDKNSSTNEYKDLQRTPDDDSVFMSPRRPFSSLGDSGNLSPRQPNIPPLQMDALSTSTQTSPIMAKQLSLASERSMTTANGELNSDRSRHHKRTVSSGSSNTLSLQPKSTTRSSLIPSAQSSHSGNQAVFSARSLASSGRTVQSNIPLDDLSPIHSKSYNYDLQTPKGTELMMYKPKRDTKDTLAILDNSSSSLSSESSDEDLDSLLNRSLELQSQIRVSHDETQSYQPISPTGKRYVPTSSPSFKRNMRRSHSVESIVGKFDLEDGMFTITSTRSNMCLEDSYTFDEDWSPRRSSPRKQEGRYRSPGHNRTQSERPASHHDPQERMSSALWAIRLIKVLHNSDPVTRQNLVTKARCFRRWLHHARAIKAERELERKRLQQALEFRRDRLLNRCFKCWKTQHKEEPNSAVASALYRKHALRKGFEGLRWAAQQSKDVEKILEQRSKQAALKKFFNTWQESVQSQRQQTLKNAFAQWQQYKLHAERMKLLENMAQKKVLSKAYSQWKAHFKAQQQQSVAELHHKVSTLSKGLKAWRLYTADSIVKRRKQDVARIHYEERLAQRMFQEMRYLAEKYRMARAHYRRKLLLSSLHQLHQATALSKAQRKRAVAESREHRKAVLLRSFFKHWRQAVGEHQAKRVAETRLVSRAFEIWQLRFRRSVLQTQMREARVSYGLKYRAFQTWFEYVQQRKANHQQATLLIEKVLCREIFVEWREYTQFQIDLRARFHDYVESTALQRKKRCFKQWKYLFLEKQSKKKARDLWSLKCVRKAVFQWHTLVYRKQLEKVVTETQPMRDKEKLRMYFKLWVKAKKRSDRDFERADIAYKVTQRTGAQRLFQRWRIMTQQQLTIAPLVSKKQRRDVARFFDSWRSVVLHKKRNYEILASFRRLQTQKIFTKWRLKTQGVLLQRDALRSASLTLLSRCIKGWQTVVHRNNACVEFSEQVERTAMKSVFEKWRQRTEDKLELQEIARGEEARKTVLLTLFMRRWQQGVEKQQKRDSIIVSAIIKRRAKKLSERCFNQWKRQYQALSVAKDFHQELQDRRLRHIISAWHNQTNNSFRDSVAQFSATLASLTPRVSAERDGSDVSNVSSVSSSGFQSNPFMSSINGLHPNDSITTSDCNSMPSPTLNGHFGHLLMDLLPSQQDSGVGSQAKMELNLRDSSIGHSTEGSSSSTPFNTPRSKCDTMIKRQLSEEAQRSLERRESYERALCLERANYEKERDSLRNFMEPLMEPLYIDINSWQSAKSIEDVLIHAITRWRHWPVSVAFAQWKEYTQHRHMLKSLQMKCQDRCGSLKKQWAFDEWKHQKICAAAANKFRESCLIRKYFTKLREYNQLQKRKTVMAEKAEEFRQASLMNKMLNAWKRKLHERFQVEGILELWQNLTSEKPQLARLGEHCKKRIELNTLRHCWHIWSMRIVQVAEVQRYHNYTIIKRCFDGWLTWAQDRAELRAKGEQFHVQNLKKKAFRVWCKRFAQNRLAERSCTMAWRHYMVVVLERWHIWAAEQRSRKKVGLQLAQKFDLRSMARMFRTWKQETHKVQQMEKIYTSSIVARCFRAWRQRVTKKNSMRQKMELFKARRKEKLLSSSFEMWKDAYLTTKLVAQCRQTRLEMRVASFAKTWREKTLEARSRRHRNRMLKVKALHHWLKEFQHQKQVQQKTLTFGLLWKEKARKCVRMEALALEQQQIFQCKQLQQAFRNWKAHCHKERLGAEHHGQKILNNCFYAWLELTEKKRMLKVLLKQNQVKKNSERVYLAFNIWKNEFLCSVRREERLEDFASQKDLDLKSQVFKAWKDHTMECRAVKHYHTTVMRKVIKAWLQWTEDSQDRQSKCVDFCDVVQQCRLRSAFNVWVDATNKQQRAKAHYENNLQKRMLYSWHSTVQRKKMLSSLCEQAQAQSQRNKLHQAFVKWRLRYQLHLQLNQLVQRKLEMKNHELLKHVFTSWALHINEVRAAKHHEQSLMKKTVKQWRQYVQKKLRDREMEGDWMDAAQQHYEASLCKKVLQALFNEVLVTRQLKKRESKLAKKYGEIWMHRVAMARAATDLKKKHVYNAIWTRWRTVLIKQRVSRTLLVQENKKIMSEIFVNWRQSTFLKSIAMETQQRQNIDKLRNSFHHWREKYHSSTSGSHLSSSAASICMSDRSSSRSSGRGSVDSLIPVPIVNFTGNF